MLPDALSVAPLAFGKSLLVSTLQALFEGRKDLFEGLHIAGKVDWEQRYPVIKLDWSLISHLSREAMEESTATYLRELAATRVRVRLKTLLDTTMDQIQEKGYCERYAATHERVTQLAVAFSGKRIVCCMKELSSN